MNLFKNRNFKPMLLSEIKKPFNNKDYIFELKYDGIRTLIYVNRTNIDIISRNGNNITKLFPELNSIKNIVKNDTIFDGEIIITENGYPSFSKLQERLHLKNKSKINSLSIENPVTFICFDILYDKENITHLNLIERKKILEKFKDNESFIKTKYIYEFGIKTFDFAKSNNLEGIVAKNINSKYYINYRSPDWIKIKNWKEEEFYICGYEINEKSVMNSLILADKKSNNFFYVGKVTIGKHSKDFKKIEQIKKVNYVTVKNYKEKNTIYIEPILKCNVMFAEKTKNGSLRQPIFKELEI